MAAVLTPAQAKARREALRALAVLLALEITGRNTEDDEDTMPSSPGDLPEPFEAANTDFPARRTGS